MVYLNAHTGIHRKAAVSGAIHNEVAVQTNLYSSYVGTKAVDEGDCADVQGCLVHLRRTGSVGR